MSERKAVALADCTHITMKSSLSMDLKKNFNKLRGGLVRKGGVVHGGKGLNV